MANELSIHLRIVQRTKALESGSSLNHGVIMLAAACDRSSRIIPPLRKVLTGIASSRS
jgi:hypothetical protein